MTSRYADVEDGGFQPRIMGLFNQAVRIAREARTLEHETDDADSEAWGRAFDMWKQQLPIADAFLAEESSPKIQRARKRGRVQRFWMILDKVFWVIVGAVLSWWFGRLLG